MRIYKTRQLIADGDLPNPQPREDVDTLARRLAALSLSFASESIGELINQAVKQRLGPPGFLDLILRWELERQEERRIQQALKISHLPLGQTISNFDFAFQPSVKRSEIETLATCQWIADRRTVLLMGPPGVGKTHLAVALGARAIESGFSVAFRRVDELLYQLKKDAEVSPARLKHKKYNAASLLIVDEMGYEPLSREEANLLFRVINYRYGRGAIALTTNKTIACWPEMLAGDEVLATAILDRLLQACHVLNIRGRSYRLKDLEEDVRRRAEQAGAEDGIKAVDSPSEGPQTPETPPEADTGSPSLDEPESG